MLNMLNQEKLQKVNTDMPIQTAQELQSDREMTRKTRGGQQLSNEDVKQLQADLKRLNEELMDEPGITKESEARRKIIKENIAQIRSQLTDARGQQSDLARTQNGRGSAAGGGGVNTYTSNYGVDSSGSSGSSGTTGTSAFTSSGN